MNLIILFLAGIASGISYIIYKRVAIEKYHPFTYVALFQSLNAILAIPLLLYWFKVPRDFSYWLLALASAGIFGLGNIFLFKAYKLIDASMVGLINRLNFVVAAILGILLLQEFYNPASYLGLILIFVGSLTVIYEKSRLVFNRGIVFAMVVAVCYGLAAFLDKILLFQFSPFSYVFFNFLFVGSGFWALGQVRREAKDLLKSKPIFILLGSLFGGGAWVAFSYVLQKGFVSRIFPIYDSLALVVTVFLGILLLGERQKLVQKAIGTILVIVGIFLLG